MIYSDLHLHFDGSLPIFGVDVLGELSLVDLPKDEDKLRELFTVGPECKDLNEYLEKFDCPLSLMQRCICLKMAIKDLIYDLRERGVDYAEIRFAPALHTREGLTQKQVLNAVLLGVEECMGVGPKIKLILCLMRGEIFDVNLYARNQETIQLAIAYKDKIAGLDLAGAEGLYPTSDFKDFFKIAKDNNIPFTIHAGEAAGPESVWSAIEMGAKRIGHGIRAAEDPELVKEIVKRGIVLEMCPTSNFQTGAVKSFAEYPLHTFMNAGVIVTINSDNMTVSNTDVKNEFKILKTYCGLADNEQIILMENAEKSHLDEL